MKEKAAQPGDAGFQRAAHVVLGFVGHARQLAKISFDVEIGILVARQQQRQLRRIERGIRFSRQATERGVEVHGGIVA